VDQSNNLAVRSLANDLRLAMGHIVAGHQNLNKTTFELSSVLDSIDHDILIVLPTGLIKLANLKAKTHLFSEILKKDSTEIRLFEDVMKQLIDPYVEQGREILEALIAKTNSVDNFIFESVKIVVTKKVKKYYEVHTSPIYNEELGHLGRIWQFEDITTAENIDNLKTEFLSIASHQLRTPLTSIRGYSDMMKSGDFGNIPTNLLEPLLAIIKASTQMENLLEDLLDVSKLEAGSLTLMHKELNIIELIKQVIESLMVQVAEKSQRINFINVAGSNSLIINSDQLRLQQAISNIVQNAIKYSGINKEITIRLTKSADWLEIEIIDQGVGIPTDQQDRIFQKFFRAANVLTENFDGTGLGLYYVKKVIEECGGKISFRSELGSGTTFTIKIPNIL